MAAPTTFLKTLCLVLALGLASCASPNDERWPTVSFGDQIEAIKAASAAPSEVALAPLPSLSDQEKAALEDQSAFVANLDNDFRDLTTRLLDRRRDFAAAVDGIANKQGEDFRDAWLTAEMELSNISQLTENLARIRARIAALGEPLPERARVLLSRAEGLELQNRLFVREQKSRLFQIEPS